MIGLQLQQNDAVSRRIDAAADISSLTHSLTPNLGLNSENARSLDSEVAKLMLALPIHPLKRVEMAFSLSSIIKTPSSIVLVSNSINGI